MQRRHFLSGAAAGLLAAPAIARAAGASTLKFVPYADLALLDPILTTNYVTRNHALMVFDTLYGIDTHYRAQPQMVAGEVSEDGGKLWTLTLRDGLSFHDGTPVLSRDVAASLRRWGRRDSFGSALFSALDDLSTPSDKVLRFRFNYPFPLLPNALGKPTSYLPVIMPERLAATDPFKAVAEMVGSGPFRFMAGERVPGALAVYRKFDAYVPRSDGEASFTAGPRTAHFDRVEWHTIPDAAAAAGALTSGEIDWWEQPSVDLVPQLSQRRDIRVEVIEIAGLVGQIRFNHLHPPFDNPAVCRAVLGAVDQSEMMDAVAGTNPDIRRGRSGFFADDGPFSSSAGLGPLTGPRDLARSRRELDAAGYKGEKVVLLSGTDVPRINAICEVMNDVCRKLGMNVDYVSTDWGTVNQRILTQKPVDQGGWSMYGVFVNGLDQLSPAYHNMMRGNGKAGNPSWLSDAPLESLREAWFRAPDLAAQQAIARTMQERAVAVGAYIPCGIFFQPSAYRADLKGVPSGLPLFTGVRRS